MFLPRLEREASPWIKRTLFLQLTRYWCFSNRVKPEDSIVLCFGGIQPHLRQATTLHNITASEGCSLELSGSRPLHLYAVALHPG